MTSAVESGVTPDAINQPNLELRCQPRIGGDRVTKMKSPSMRTASVVTICMLLGMLLFLYLKTGLTIGNVGMMKEFPIQQAPVCTSDRKDIQPLNDFKNYPCLWKDPSKRDLLPAGCVRTVCLEKVFGMSDSNATNCVPLKNVNRNICTHDPKQDLLAGILHRTGFWERGLVDTMLKTLQTNPQLTFLDLGCNIGVYTIAAASNKSKAICVDADPENLRLVSKSISLGHLENSVTLIWNALSDHRGEVNFQIIKGNAGASRIGDIKKYKLPFLKNISVNAILLDDLQMLLEGKQIFMKMDIESHELFVLRGASQFFKNVDVQIIQMELAEPDTFNTVVELLYMWGYLMFRDPLGTQRLDRKDKATKNWPGDVYFVKVSRLNGSGQ